MQNRSQHNRFHVGQVDLKVATLPVLVGLQLLAEFNCRLSVTRDIDQVSTILESVNGRKPDVRIGKGLWDDFELA